MVINMDESQLRTIEQIEQFLAASAKVAFAAHGGDMERYAHISRVLKRFDYPRRNKHERGVLLRYLQHSLAAPHFLDGLQQVTLEFLDFRGYLRLLASTVPGRKWGQ